MSIYLWLPIFLFVALLAILHARDTLVRGKFVITYKYTDNAIEIYLYKRIVIKRIPYSEITKVEKFTPLETLLGGFAGGTMSRSLGPYVRIERDCGNSLDYVLTPDEPDLFIAMIRKKIGNQSDKCDTSLTGIPGLTKISKKDSSE